MGSAIAGGDRKGLRSRAQAVVFCHPGRVHRARPATIFKPAVIILAAGFRPSLASGLRPRRSPRGARDAGVAEDPQTSAPRDTEACRAMVEPQVRRSSGVPRAVFEACSAGPPVVRLFRSPLACAVLGDLTTAEGVWPCARGTAPDAQWPPYPCGAQPALRDPAAWAAARWVCVLHPCAATAIPSRLHDASRSALGGQDCADYSR